MSQSDFHALVGKVLSDEAFAKSLVENPEQTLKDAGIEPTPEMLESLNGVDTDSIKRLAASLGDDKAAG